MGASSITGIGQGAAGKVTGVELEIFANGPSIIFAGHVESLTDGAFSSPPADGNVVYFSYPLKGGANKYSVFLTTLNAGTAYVRDFIEDVDGNFTGFWFVAEAEGTVMYMVVKNGTKSNFKP